MMKKLLRNIFSLIVFAIVVLFCMIGIQKTYEFTANLPSRITVTTDKDLPDTGWQLKEPSQSTKYIDGPLVAGIGELCVFRLSDKETKADWVIVPPAKCYIDSSGSSLAFSSNTQDRYTIIAAVVEEGVPKILTHICEYGTQPEPNPKPDPTPKPNPPNPNFTLKDWVTQNVPESGQKQAAALASCYESAANGIESGSIHSQEAALSVIRTASQTKIDNETWSEFLDTLSERITEKLAGNSDVKSLGTIFSEIAEGLRERFQASDVGLQEIATESLEPEIIHLEPEARCQGPHCQPQPKIQYRRWR